MSIAEFNTTVAQFSAKLRDVIRRRVRAEAATDDLTQQTPLKVFPSRAALRVES